MNLSIGRINPVGLRILSLRGCTATCIVNSGFEGSSRGGAGILGWECGTRQGLDQWSEVKACCMLRVSGFVGAFLGEVLPCGVACSSCTLCRMAMGDIEPACLPACLLPAERCGCWPMPTAMTHTWLWACPALAHTQEHAHNPTAIILPCLLSLVPNAHVRRYVRWMPTGWDENGKRPQPGPSLFCSIRRCFHWSYLV